MPTPPNTTVEEQNEETHKDFLRYGIATQQVKDWSAVEKAESHFMRMGETDYYIYKNAIDTVVFHQHSQLKEAVEEMGFGLTDKEESGEDVSYDFAFRSGYNSALDAVSALLTNKEESK